MKKGIYFLAKEPNNRFSIRQRVVMHDGTIKQPRYPGLRRISNSEVEMQNLVNILNERLNANKKEVLEFRSKLLPQSLIREFKETLRLNIPNEKDCKYLYNTVFQKYFLGFFIGKLNVLDPQEWIKHQDKWAASLMSVSKNKELNIFESEVSAKTIKHTVQIANRFMAFLNLKQPNHFQKFIFSPIGKSALKDYSARLKLKNDEEIGKFIKDEDWIIINSCLPDDTAPFVRLMYFYGLRRAESLGFNSTVSVKNSYLKVEKQLKSINLKKVESYKVLKDKEMRKTPHWFCTPLDCYNFIEAGLSKKVCPDTLYDKWESFISSIGLNYRPHDFRRTFITKALRIKSPRDVQLAVGHAMDCGHFNVDDEPS